MIPEDEEDEDADLDDESMDPVQRANAELAKSLNELAELSPGIPPPRDPLWEQEQAAEGLTAEEPKGSLLDRAATLPQVLNHKGRTKRGSYRKSPQKIKLDTESSEEDWHRVAAAYRHTGIPAQLAAELEMPVAKVEHLLNEGIWRLELQPIKTFMVNYAEVNRRLAERGLPAQRPGEIEERAIDVQQAITDRVAREATAAMKGLEAASLGSGLIHYYVSKVIAGIQDRSIPVILPPLMTPADLGGLMTLVTMANKAVAVAVKTTRLVAGEPTEIISAKVARMLEGRPIHELEQIERHGLLPGLKQQLQLEAHQLPAIDAQYTEGPQGTDIEEALAADDPIDDVKPEDAE